jgi:hypothetical protein
MSSSLVKIKQKVALPPPSAPSTMNYILTLLYAEKAFVQQKKHENIREIKKIRYCLTLATCMNI